jgi:hypothetical protein
MTILQTSAPGNLIKKSGIVSVSSFCFGSVAEDRTIFGI